MAGADETRSLGTAMTVDPAAPLGEGIAADRLRAVYQIGRALLEEREPSLVVRAIQSAIVSSLAPDHACVLAAIPGGGYRPLSSHEIDLTGPEDGWPLSHTVVQRVRDTGLALLAADAPVDPQLDGSESVQRFQIRSIMCVPLGRDPVRGVLYVDRRGGHGGIRARRPGVPLRGRGLRGSRPGAGRKPDAHRAGAGEQPRAAAAPARGTAAPPHRRPLESAARRVRHGEKARGRRRARAAARRDRDGQGTVRARLRAEQPAGRRPLRPDPDSRALPDDDRIGAVRSCARRVHRSGARQEGAPGDRRGGRPLPR